MNIDVETLRDKRERGDDFLLLDVRNDNEIAMARLDPHTQIPLPELAERVGELDAWRDREIVVMCHLGARSRRAQQFLLEQGFTQVHNLSGGIHAWSERIDARVPVYD